MSAVLPAVSRIAARGLALSYANRAVLKAVGLDVHDRELLAILGPSGSGKSSLLRLLAGLRIPDAGQVRVDGELLNGPRPDVALAFQDACLLPWLSVERNVGFGLGFSRQPHLTRAERRERVDAALQAVGLAHAHLLYPGQLSGGMAQRVAIARCLVRRPRVLLLDEPFGALDQVTRAGMQDLLLQVVRDTGAAAVLVTHDIDEALRIADRVVVLGNAGSLILELQMQLPAPRGIHIAAVNAQRLRILQALHDSMTHVAVAPALAAVTRHPVPTRI
jgi:NitT/TauT family transport system ATP-binding protein